MKKLFCTLLAALMIFSMSSVVFAEETTTLKSTVSVSGSYNPNGSSTPTDSFEKDTESAENNVTYVGSDNSNYTITVPATLDPGKSGDITIDGVWPTGSKLTFSASNTVTLTDSVSGDTDTLNVSFSITDQKAEYSVVTANGSHTVTIAGNSSICFAEKYSIGLSAFAPILGNWNGTITYNVSYTPGATATVPTQTYNFTYKDRKNTVYNYSFEAKENMTWEEFVASDHNTNDLFSLVFPEYKENGSEFTIIVFNSTDTVFCNGLTQVKSNTPLSQATEYFHAIEN